MRRSAVCGHTGRVNDIVAGYETGAAVAACSIHLLAHGFFKALLFLGSGSVIHGCHEEQDIRRMGGLRRLMPVTFFSYAIGMMALSGVPIFFAGAWTKEEIVHATSQWPVSQIPYHLTLAGVGACEGQIRDIGTGDEEKKSHRAQQHEERTAQIARDHFLEADREKAPLGLVGWISNAFA